MWNMTIWRGPSPTSTKPWPRRRAARKSRSRSTRRATRRGSRRFERSDAGCRHAVRRGGLSRRREFRRLSPTRWAKTGAVFDDVRSLSRRPLIMNGPERNMRAREDLDPSGSGERRSGHPEAGIVVPVVWVVPVAIRGAEVPRIVVPGAAAKDPTTRDRSGFGGPGWIEPAAREDRMAQAPRVGVRGMSDPGPHAEIDGRALDRSVPPLVA